MSLSLYVAFCPVDHPPPVFDGCQATRISLLNRALSKMTPGACHSRCTECVAYRNRRAHGKAAP